MTEIAGGLERPADSSIMIEVADGRVVITIPRPRMPIGIYAVIAASALTSIASVAAGMMIFVFERTFPGSNLFVAGPPGNMPLAWRLFGISGLLALAIAGMTSFFFAVVPLTRREVITVDGSGVSISEKTFVKSIHRSFAHRDAGEFRNRHDPVGLRESELVLLLNRPLLAEGRDEVEFAQSTSEAEKEWLARTLNLVLTRLRRE